MSERNTLVDQDLLELTAGEDSSLWKRGRQGSVLACVGDTVHITADQVE